MVLQLVNALYIVIDVSTYLARAREIYSLELELDVELELELERKARQLKSTKTTKSDTCKCIHIRQ